MDKQKLEGRIATRASARVVYALPDRQETVDVPLAPGMNVEDAVRRSGLLERFPEAAARPLACAIFGRPAALTRVVQTGERIEILRPLAIDPKESRRQAAQAQRKRR